MPNYDYTFKILLLGDASVGKTSFTKRYCYNIFNPSERLTIGVDFHVKTIELNNKTIKLQIWDVGGEERFRFLLPTYCLGANAAFLLYDTTRPATLDNIPEWTSIVRQKGGKIMNQIDRRYVELIAGRLPSIPGKIDRLFAIGFVVFLSGLIIGAIQSFIIGLGLIGLGLLIAGISLLFIRKSERRKQAEFLDYFDRTGELLPYPEDINRVVDTLPKKKA